MLKINYFDLNFVIVYDLLQQTEINNHKEGNHLVIFQSCLNFLILIGYNIFLILQCQ